jgi:hypothetical protein
LAVTPFAPLENNFVSYIYIYIYVCIYLTATVTFSVLFKSPFQSLCIMVWI